jgi:IS4 transposase
MFRCIDRLAALGTGIVTLSGGEALLHPDLDVIGQSARLGPMDVVGQVVSDWTVPQVMILVMVPSEAMLLSRPLFEQEINYRETKHFLITRDFLNSPERFFKHLFETVEDTGTDA